MIAPILSTLGTFVALVMPGLAEAPRSSAAVVSASFARFTIADGLESCFVTLTVKPGWYVYANPGSAKESAKADAANGISTDAARGVAMEFRLDGVRASVNDVYHPPGAVKTDGAGKRYLQARVRMIAIDGTTRLKEAATREKENRYGGVPP